ncbi:MAG: hypothetical protein L7W43_09660 [Rubripirellula sp.]|nr:hypothetical protein [Rubripirellula sp.]
MTSKPTNFVRDGTFISTGGNLRTLKKLSMQVIRKPDVSTAYAAEIASPPPATLHQSQRTGLEDSNLTTPTYRNPIRTTGGNSWRGTCKDSRSRR